MTGQLPESKANAALRHLKAELRNARRKDGPAVTVVLKLPAGLAAWVQEQAAAGEFETRQGFILETLRLRKESGDNGQTNKKRFA